MNMTAVPINIGNTAFMTKIHPSPLLRADPTPGGGGRLEP